jgi:hypothetical protein
MSWRTKGNAGLMKENPNDPANVAIDGQKVEFEDFRSAVEFPISPNSLKPCLALAAICYSGRGKLNGPQLSVIDD